MRFISCLIRPGLDHWNPLADTPGCLVQTFSDSWKPRFALHASCLKVAAKSQNKRSPKQTRDKRRDEGGASKKEPAARDRRSIGPGALRSPELFQH